MNNNNELIKKEFNELAIVNEYIESKEMYLAAKEQYEIKEYQLKKALMPLFKKYDIKRLDNDQIQAIRRDGYYRYSWDKEKLEKLFDELGEPKENYQTSTFIDETITIKYKEGK